jgi:hypothetical protein
VVVVRVLQVCLSGVLLAACTGGSSGSSATAPPPAPASAPIAAPLIDIRPITITFKGLPIAKLHPDGSTESVGDNPPGGAMSPGPTLHADGTIQLAKGLTARIASGGEIYVVSPDSKEELFGRIDGDHLALGAENKGIVHFDGNMMTFDNGRDDVGKIEGVVDAGIRRTALVMFATFLVEKYAR